MPHEHPSRSTSFWRGVVRLWRFDLQRFRVLIAVVVALELLRAAFIEWFLHLAPLATDGGFGSDLGSIELQTLDGALWLATAIATAILVQADHPVDDRAFWRTRPISTWQLGIAKLTLLSVVFVAVPAFVNAVRLGSYGAPPTAFVAATVQIAVTAGWIVVAMLGPRHRDADAATVPGERRQGAIAAGVMLVRVDRALSAGSSRGMRLPLAIPCAGDVRSRLAARRASRMAGRARSDGDRPCHRGRPLPPPALCRRRALHSWR